MTSPGSSTPRVPPHLAIRADGGEGIGAGHLARCLALAQAWRDRKGRVTLVTAAIPLTWRARYEAEGVSVVATDRLDADLWVVDGYHLGPPPGVADHVRIDDRGTSHDASASLVVDQNLGAQPGDYRQPPTSVLAGLRYALLRRELVAASVDPVAPPSPEGPLRVLVAAGGSPTAPVRRFAAAVAAELAAPRWDVTVWTGTDDPVPALRSSHAAVAAAGSTLWELCRFGVAPVVVSVADNQVPLARAAAEAGLAVDGGSVTGASDDADPVVVAAQVRALMADEPARRALVARQRAAVDGWGPARVATRLWGSALRVVPVGGSHGGAPRRWQVLDAVGERWAVVELDGDGRLTVDVAPEPLGPGALGALVEVATRSVDVELHTTDVGISAALRDADADLVRSEGGRWTFRRRSFEGPEAGPD